MVVMCAVAVSVDVTPTVLSSLLSWLCSSFAGDGANCGERERGGGGGERERERELENFILQGL